MSRWPYWCPKTMKQRPCWCPKLISHVSEYSIKFKVSFVSYSCIQGVCLLISKGNMCSRQCCTPPPPLETFISSKLLSVRSLVSVFPVKFFKSYKKNICIRKEFNSHRISLGHQHGHHLIVLGHQYGFRDVMCILSILQSISHVYFPSLSILFLLWKGVGGCVITTSPLSVSHPSIN